MSEKASWHWSKTVAATTTLVDFVASESAISKSLAKKVLTFGGGWIQPRGATKRRRCRRAQQALSPGDKVDFYFDQRLLMQTYPQPQPLLETDHWGLWHKPAGLLAQGTPYGDQGCMEMQIRTLRPKQDLFLIHRLDREAAGLMIFGYHKRAATQLSALWAASQVEKVYQAEVAGRLPDKQGRIEIPLDGKAAATRYTVTGEEAGGTQVTITLESGRYHQIRRHFAAIGHPLIGDPRYGRDNKNREGLRLCAYALRFSCPLTQSYIDYELPRELRLFG